jgi:hypothetical protein
MNRLLFLVIIILLTTGCTEQTPVSEPTIKPKQEPNKKVEIYPRESKIPTDAVKMTPETDEYPPQLHSDEYEQPIPM